MPIWSRADRNSPLVQLPVLSAKLRLDEEADRRVPQSQQLWLEETEQPGLQGQERLLEAAHPRMLLRILYNAECY